MTDENPHASPNSTSESTDGAADSCDRCGVPATDADIDQTLTGELLCRACQESRREKDTSRELGQSSLFDASQSHDE